MLTIASTAILRAKARLFIGLLALLFVSDTVLAGNRVALIIGNSKYAAAPVLGNPVNDASDLAEALRAIGFKVLEQHDAARLDMEEAIRKFAGEITPDDLVLFYFAGHGMQIAGENYLVPVDADIRKMADARFEAIRLSDVIQTIKGHASIFILDACRDNPFPAAIDDHRGIAARGFNRMEPTTAGMLLVYATAPDRVAADGAGRNSPFTTALLKYLPTPGLEIHKLLAHVGADVMLATQNEQVPWENGSLTDDVYLSPSPAGPEPVPPAPVVPRSVVQPDFAADAGSTELLYWQSVARADTRELYLDYIHQYGPRGHFTDIARQRILDLSRPSAPLQSTLPRSNWPQSTSPQSTSPQSTSPPQSIAVRPPPASSNSPAGHGPSVPSSYWTHNGSIVYLTKSGDRRQIFYENPKSSLSILSIRPGTLLFDGRISGSVYSGQAFTFVKDCPPLGFSVSGSLSADERQFTLAGSKPVRNLHCHILDYEAQTLIFTFEKSAAH